MLNTFLLAVRTTGMLGTVWHRVKEVICTLPPKKSPASSYAYHPTFAGVHPTGGIYSNGGQRQLLQSCILTLGARGHLPSGYIVSLL